jgi:hypothetical protein
VTAAAFKSHQQIESRFQKKWIAIAEEAKRGQN